MMPLEFSFLERLNLVQARLRQELNFKPVKFEELVHLDMDDLDQTVCPAIVLAVSRYCGDEGPQTVALAAIIQLIYMANQVHKLMKDDSDLAEEQRQFPVLVGDLLYGKFFLHLCQDKLLPFLAPLAHVMWAMSEGGISRWLARDQKISKEEWLEIIEKESASITGTAARLSAELASVSVPLQKKFEEFGLELGRAWGASKQRLGQGVVQGILQKAHDILGEISSGDQLQLQPLREVYNFVAERLNENGYLQEAGS